MSRPSKVANIGALRSNDAMMIDRPDGTTATHVTVGGLKEYINPSLANTNPTSLLQDTDLIGVERSNSPEVGHISVFDLKNELGGTGAEVATYTHPDPSLTGISLPAYQSMVVVQRIDGTWKLIEINGIAVDPIIDTGFTGDDLNSFASVSGGLIMAPQDPAAYARVEFRDEAGDVEWIINYVAGLDESLILVWNVVGDTGWNDLRNPPYLFGSNNEKTLVNTDMNDYYLYVYLKSEIPATETETIKFDNQTSMRFVIFGINIKEELISNQNWIKISYPVMGGETPGQSVKTMMVGREQILTVMRCETDLEWESHGELATVLMGGSSSRSGWGNSAEWDVSGEFLRRFTLNEKQYLAIADDNGIEVSYTELKTLLTDGGLFAGAIYKMAFTTTHTIKGTAQQNSGNPETICFLAYDNYTLHPFGVIRGDDGVNKYLDIVLYEFDSTVLAPHNYAGDYPHGRITYRKDTIRNIEAHEDFRAIKYRRHTVGATVDVESGSLTGGQITLNPGLVLTGGFGRQEITFRVAGSQTMLTYHFGSDPQQQGFIPLTDGDTGIVAYGLSFTVTGSAGMLDGDYWNMQVNGNFWYFGDADELDGSNVPIPTIGYMDFYTIDNTWLPLGTGIHLGNSPTKCPDIVIGHNVRDAHGMPDYIYSPANATNTITIQDHCEDMTIGSGCSVIDVAHSYGNLIIKDGCHHIHIGTCGDGSRVGRSCSSIYYGDNTHATMGYNNNAIHIGDEVWASIGSGCEQINISQFSGQPTDMVIVEDDCFSIDVEQQNGGLTIPTLSSHTTYPRPGQSVVMPLTERVYHNYTGTYFTADGAAAGYRIIIGVNSVDFDNESVVASDPSALIGTDFENHWGQLAISDGASWTFEALPATAVPLRHYFGSQAIIWDGSTFVTAKDFTSRSDVQWNYVNPSNGNLTISPIGGICVRLVAGEDLLRGELVYQSQAGDAMTATKNPIAGDMPFGTVLDDATISSDVWITVSGIGYALPASGVALSQGHILFQNTGVAGRVSGAATIAGAQHNREMGHALETGATDVAVRAVLHFN